MRHNFITGQVLLLKCPNNLNVVRRDLKELSDIVEREDILSASSLHIPKETPKNEGSQKVGIESEMAYNIKLTSVESPQLVKSVHLTKANTGFSVYDNEIVNGKNDTNKPKITINLFNGDCDDTGDGDIDEGEIILNWRYSFKGPVRKKD